jgi:hypothetical protein
VSADATRERVARERAAQGLPPTVECPATLATVAALLDASLREDPVPGGQAAAR